MEKKINYRTANCIFVSAVLLLGAAACNKEAVAPHTGAPKISTDLGVSPPPVLRYWAKEADVPFSSNINKGIGREWAFSFAIGGRGYIGAGGITEDGVSVLLPYNDVWAFDTVNAAWTQRASFPGTARSGMASFTIGGSGYVCTGTPYPASSSESYIKQVWQYDPAGNTWTRKKNFPGDGRYAAVGAASGGFGYPGTGTTPLSSASSDWWQYDPAADSWVQKAPMPGNNERCNAVAFAPTQGNGKVYVTTGINLGTNLPVIYNDLWEYDPAQNSWTQRANLPAAGRWGAAAASLKQTGIVATGSTNLYGATGSNDSWEYVPASDRWVSMPTVGGGYRYNGVGFGIGDHAFVATGKATNIGAGPRTDCWMLVGN